MSGLIRWARELIFTRLVRRQRPRIKNSALMLMYSGTGYCGMQRQRAQHLPTIEGALLDGLLAAGHISADQHARPGAKLGFNCASKTDSGVSALAQVVTLRLAASDLWAVKRDLNARLPERLRVLDAIRVTGGFVGRYRVRHRVYAYLCPSFAFSSRPLPSAFDYRLEPHRLRALRRCLDGFLGTRNFCNFTTGRLPDDPACARHIFDYQVDGPLLYGGLEFVEIRLVGQSFMRHQIRKMIGLCIAIVRGHFEASALDAALSPHPLRRPAVEVPRAPGLGLWLDELSYERYNSEHATRLGYPTLDWERFGAERRAFKAAHLLPDIYEGETAGRCMLDWLEWMSVRHPVLCCR